MKPHKLFIAFCVPVIFIASGCGESSKNNTETAVESDNLIQITVQQFEADSMNSGELTLHSFEAQVSCNGYITAPPNGIAQVSAPVSGIVESINCAIGENVRKGQVLALIASNDLMMIQQEFTESSAKLKRLKLDYERSKSLFVEKIGAEKDFIAIESEYKSMLSKYNSLKLRLQLLKLDITKIESGDLYAVFPLIAPIYGNITTINLLLGQFIEQQKNLVEIVDVNQLQLQLSVFENEVGKLKIGQNVQFKTTGEASLTKSATLTSISKTINPESKTILCTARITSKEGANLINNSFIEARIGVNRKEANALPTEALLKSGKDYYVYEIVKSDKEAYFLKKVKVEIGMTSEGFTEIIGEKALTKVLIKGVYNLPAQ
jgi:cobalt-zinc-cadmium efflux system membrane fusion protein